MPTVTFQPSGRTLIVAPGTNLLEACHRAGVAIAASCGSKGLCGKCRLRLLAGSLPEHTGYEHALSQSESDAGWRLACLCEVTDDLTIETDTARPTRSVILTDGSAQMLAPDGLLRRVSLTLAPPSLHDQADDLSRLRRALGFSPECTLDLLQNLPKRLRENAWHISAVLDGDTLLSIAPADATAPVLGMAYDLGTTTIAGLLIDMQSGMPLARTSRINPQGIRGEDVVSRIEYRGNTAAGKTELQTLVADALQEILQEACAMAGVEPAHVFRVSVAGNTTMHHLLLGLDPTAIAHSPFIPAACHTPPIPADVIGLACGEGARLHALPHVSAYVGGDLVAGVLAHGLHESEETILLIDVGTNGEMALRAGGTTYACSTAAGSAFEGAGIRCGMRAASGAIKTVTVHEEDLLIATIDNAPPRGLCGTGLLDAIAALLDLDVLDETGRLLDAETYRDEIPGAFPKIAERLTVTEHGAAIILAINPQDAFQVLLTQKDIRQFQLAKGALAAGARILLGEIGIEDKALDRVLLAGAFGHALNPRSALRVGLLPEGISLEAIEAVGNASLDGARLCLLREDMRENAARIAREIAYRELSGRPEFQTAFADAMEFPDSGA